MFTTHQYPIAQDWLTVKLTLVLVYIGLGVMALRKGRSARARARYLVAAIIVHLVIVSIARRPHQLGVFVRHSDRKSVQYVQSVTVRVALGGGGISQTKITTDKT